MSPFFEPPDAWIIPFGLLWAGFMCVFVWSVGSNPWFFVPVSIPLVLIGLYVSVGRLLFRRARREHTNYVLTSRRAFILTSLRREVVRELDLRRAPVLKSNSLRDGSGTIEFESPLSNPMQRIWGAGREMDFTFVNIPNVNEVKALASTAHLDQR